jgi:hypothetical protein
MTFCAKYWVIGSCSFFLKAIFYEKFSIFLSNLNVRSATKIDMFFLQPIILRSFKESMLFFFLQMATYLFVYIEVNEARKKL